MTLRLKKDQVTYLAKKKTKTTKQTKQTLQTQTHQTAPTPQKTTPPENQPNPIPITFVWMVSRCLYGKLLVKQPAMSKILSYQLCTSTLVWLSSYVDCTAHAFTAH